MKLLLKLFLLLIPFYAQAQGNLPDSLWQLNAEASNDSMQYAACRQLYTYYEELNRDSALHYANQRLMLSRKNNKNIIAAYDLGIKSYQLIYLGKFGEALACLLQSKHIAESSADMENDEWPVNIYPLPGKTRLVTLALANHMFGHLMQQTENTSQQLYYFKEGRKIGLAIDSKFRIIVADMVLGSSYVAIDQPDSALFFAKEAESVALQSGIKRWSGYIYFVMGDVYFKKGNMELASEYYHTALQTSQEQYNLTNEAGCYSRLIKYHIKAGHNDSVLYYALKNLVSVKAMGAVTAAAGLDINIGSAYEQLYIGYALQNQFDSAYRYQGLALNAKDSLNRIKIRNLAAFQNLSFDEQLRLQNIEKEKLMIQSKIRTYAMLAGIGVFMLIAFLLYRNNRNRRKANMVLQQQKEELQITLSELKSTQSQLIQSEKMASLGELTAGIAHEIQNPLNFVNNFSDVNRELADELEQEAEKGNLKEVQLLARDIKDNEAKINHHGKRADAIVKNMLQHSRAAGGGVKEPTNINALAEEYLRLAYHGLRAKDKSFNADLQIELDRSIGMVNIIPQDIGRVLLNLFNNSFYAVNKKGKREVENYQPVVSLKTEKKDDEVTITVRDNGDGIPESIKDKIFQPFFTTKPTGEGTGLGLSLSYDIVKAHGGKINIMNIQDGGVEVIISLPVLY